MMSEMKINVSFLAGSDLKGCVIEAKEKANAFDVAYIEFDFNGISFSIGKTCNVDKVMSDWHKGDTKYGIISA